MAQVISVSIQLTSLLDQLAGYVLTVPTRQDEEYQKVEQLMC
ncbi:hypothetical protein [Peribacillus simplex]|nr:hypothetical protein [Peribacillus simplex]WHY95329.1 hypothetical protein QNH37_14975 [Peribacillus simplex]